MGRGPTTAPFVGKRVFTAWSAKRRALAVRLTGHVLASHDAGNATLHEEDLGTICQRHSAVKEQGS